MEKLNKQQERSYMTEIERDLTRMREEMFKGLEKMGKEGFLTCRRYIYSPERDFDENCIDIEGILDGHRIKGRYFGDLDYEGIGKHYSGKHYIDEKYAKVKRHYGTTRLSLQTSSHEEDHKRSYLMIDDTMYKADNEERANMIDRFFKKYAPIAYDIGVEEELIEDNMKEKGVVKRTDEMREVQKILFE